MFPLKMVIFYSFVSLPEGNESADSDIFNGSALSSADSPRADGRWELAVDRSFGMNGCVTNPGGFKHGLYFPSYMGCHPNPIDELIFFKMVTLW